MDRRKHTTACSVQRPVQDTVYDTAARANVDHDRSCWESTTVAVSDLTSDVRQGSLFADSLRTPSDLKCESLKLDRHLQGEVLDHHDAVHMLV